MASQQNQPNCDDASKWVVQKEDVRDDVTNYGEGSAERMAQWEVGETDDEWSDWWPKRTVSQT